MVSEISPCSLVSVPGREQKGQEVIVSSAGKKVAGRAATVLGQSLSEWVAVSWGLSGRKLAMGVRGKTFQS